MAVPAWGEEAEGELTSARWRSLCERFHEIRLGASRHGLSDTWHQLASADPVTPDLLTQWEMLDEQILTLDQDDDYGFARRGFDPAEFEDDDWDAAADEYVCPTRRCDRRETSYLGVIPRCELFRRDMEGRPGE